MLRDNPEFDSSNIFSYLTSTSKSGLLRHPDLSCFLSSRRAFQKTFQNERIFYSLLTEFLSISNPVYRLLLETGYPPSVPASFISIDPRPKWIFSFCPWILWFQISEALHLMLLSLFPAFFRIPHRITVPNGISFLRPTWSLTFLRKCFRWDSSENLRY